MRARPATPIPCLLGCVVLCLAAAAAAAQAQTVIDGGSDTTISIDITDGLVVSGGNGGRLTIEERLVPPPVTVSTNVEEARAAIDVEISDYTVNNGGFVQAGDALSDESAIYFASGNNTLVNDGDLRGGTYVVRSEDSNGTLTFTNSEGGNIETDGSGLKVEGVSIVTNRGTIDSFFEALVLKGGGTVTNEGEGSRIESNGAAIKVGVSSADVSIEISNEGTIESSGGVATVILEGVNPLQKLVNGSSGTITHSSADVIQFESPDAELINEGTISTSGDGVGVVMKAGGTLTNSGTISAESASAVVFEEGDATFTNSGTISTGAGNTAPAVRMGAGDDVVILTTGSTINGDIDGGGGDNDLFLEGSGSFASSLLGIERLELGSQAAGGEAWTLSGESEVGEARVSSGKLTLESGGNGFSVPGDFLVEPGAGLENRGLLRAGQGVVFGDSDDEFVNAGTLRRIDGDLLASVLDMGGGDDVVILQDAGSVEGVVDGGLGDDTLRLSGAGGTLSGGTAKFENVEHLQMLGSTWSVSGTISGFEDATLSSGTLSLADGASLDVPLVTVDPGATLATGVDAGATLSDVLVNHGLVSPIGVGSALAVLGDFSQSATGSLQVLVGPSNAGKLQASGAANLAGELVVLASGFTGDPINQVVFEAGSLAADQKFEEPEDLPLLEVLVCYGNEACPVPSTPGVDPAPSPGANRVSVQLVQVATFEDIATTRNQQAVAAAVDAMLNAGVDDPSLDALFDLPDPSSVDAALDQLSPEPLGATAQLAFENARWYTSLLSDRLRESRLGVQVAAREARAGSQWAALGGGGAPLLRFSPVLAAPAALATDATPAGRRSGVWRPRVSGYAVVSDLGSGGGYTGYESVTGVLGLGAERWIQEDLLLGAELSASYTDLESKRNGTDFDAVAGRLAVYGSYGRGPWYLDLVSSYAYHWYDATRRIRYGTGVTAVDTKADSDHGAHEISEYLGTGLHFEIGGWDFGPEVSLQYTALIEDSYSESSAAGLGLDVRSRTEDSLSTRVGVRVSKPLRLDENNIVLPKFRVDWAHEWLDTSQDLAARFEVSPVGAFEVASRSLGRDAVVARAGLQAALAENLLVDVEYGVDAGRSDYLSQQVSVIFSGRF